MGKLKVKAPRQFEATLRRLRHSPKKAKLVMDMVRGKNVVDALNTLKFTHNRAARHIEKTIRSAMANAEDLSNRDGLGIDAESLVVCEARVEESIILKRWRPRSRGMANPMARRFSHLHIKLIRPEDLEALQLYRKIVSQKLRVDRIDDLKGLEVIGGEAKAEPVAAAAESDD